MDEVLAPLLRVMAVDDWIDTADSLGALLRLWGHEVRLARDGPEALREAVNFRPDVVLLDVGLGDMDGYEVARRFRADTMLARVFLICISGHGRAEDRQRARDAGFDEFLLKPADPVELRQLLTGRAALLNQSRTHGKPTESA